MYKKLINKRMYSNKFKIDKRVNNFSNIFIKELLLLHLCHHDSTKSDVTKCNTSV